MAVVFTSVDLPVCSLLIPLFYPFKSPFSSAFSDVCGLLILIYVYFLAFGGLLFSFLEDGLFLSC